MADLPREDQNIHIKNGNYTKIHNKILEALMKTHLSGYEIKIILAIWRKVYGWRKKEDFITFKQFQEMTNLPKSEVSRTLARLKRRNLVVENHNSRPVKYKFNKHFTEWEELAKPTTVVENYNQSCRNLHQPMEKSTTKKSEDTTKNKPPSVPKETSTKETSTKETKHVKSSFQPSQNSKNLEQEINKLIELYKKTFPEHIKVFKTGAIICMRDLIKLAVSRGTPLEAVRDRIQESKTGTPWEIVSEDWMKEIKRPKTDQEIIEYQTNKLGWSPYKQVMEAKGGLRKGQNNEKNIG